MNVTDPHEPSARAGLGWMIPALLAPLLGGLRWAMQDSGNVYTTLSREFYVADPVLGFRRVAGPPWIGLDALGALVALAVGVVGLAWLLRRFPRFKWSRQLRWACTAAGAVALAVPVVIFLRGGRPPGGLDVRPAGAGVVAVARGVQGSLDLPAGTYRVRVESPTEVVASLAAGGEAFEARFQVKAGEWIVDPRDLTQPMRARVVADATSVDTGISARSNHAREYLQVTTHPELIWELASLDGAALGGNDVIAFSAQARMTIMGQTLTLPTRGSLKALDAAAKQALGVTAAHAALVEAQLDLDIRETLLAGDVNDFDKPVFSIRVTLIVLHEAQGEAQ